LEEGRGGERGGFVGVGAVDGDVEGLVGDLPEEDAACLLLSVSADVVVVLREGRTFRLGVSMPAVTTRLEMTKQDMRKGRRTGWPVSGARQ
jgi:hypothetical protein